MSVTKKDKEDWEQGKKDWLKACEKKGYKKLDDKSGQEVQREQCKGKTILEMIEGG
ncbi:hypothetical protein ES708_10895 [subsurface metagenome]